MSSINHFFQNLKSLFLAYPDFSTYGILIIFAYLLARALIKRSRLKLNDLDALGFFRKDISTEKVWSESLGSYSVVEKVKSKTIDVFFKTPFLLVFTKYNRAFDLDKFRSLTEQLSHIYQKKVVKIESRRSWFGQPHIEVYFENWPKEYKGETQKPPAFGSFLVGQDASGADVFQEFISGESSLFIAGQKGSGKTQAIISLVHSFFKNQKHRELFDLIIIDAKLNDFIVLNETYGGEIYDSTDFEQLSSAVDSLTSRCTKWNQIKKDNNDARNPVANYLKYNGPKPKNFILIIDEAAQFLSSEIVKPPSKDSSEAEKLKYEFFKKQRLLSSLLDHILAVHRFFGNLVVISSQSALIASDYSFSSTNLRTMLLSRGSSAQASQQLTGSQTMLLDTDLKKGKWIYISSGNEPRKVQTPFTTLEVKPPSRDKEEKWPSSPLDYDEEKNSDGDSSEPLDFLKTENSPSEAIK